MGKREPQTILKTDECRLHLELGRERKLTATSSGWHEGWLFLQGDKLEVAVKNDRWVLTRLPAGRGRSTQISSCR